MAGRLAELSAQVLRASELRPDVAGLGTDRMLPVIPELAALFPAGGLRRGSTVTLSSGGLPGATSLMLALLAQASRAGSWCAIAGVPGIGLVAASELGIALDRLALVPHPGVSFDKIVATLLDGFDIVVAAPSGVPSPSVRMQLSARARQHGSILMPFLGGGATWDGADMALSPQRSAWHGLEWGKGRLRSREMTVCARGRGAGARPRHITFWLPGPPVQAPSRPQLTLVR